ncbi:T9SS type A sorting domain-containing protein [Bacteroidales bacterium OttesenSCG-928-C19]|nr:T9SS type A sorting domain-containing protein [Bacteroidales bacterium OttesenSCG-928-C19]
MKKIYFVFLLFVATNVFANPIKIRPAIISEIYFNESGGWTIELTEMFTYYYQTRNIDSIKVECIAETGNVLTVDTTFYQFFFTRNDLDNPVAFSKESDKIKVYSFLNNGDIYTDSIAIGNHPESYLRNIKSGQSIAWGDIHHDYFFPSKPNIGDWNSFENALCGKIYGYLYDVDGELIRNRRFKIGNATLTAINVDENGFYLATLFENSYSLSKIRLFHEIYYWEEYKYYSIEEITLNIEENDSINVDFRLTEALVSIEDIDTQTRLLSNYPNPATDYTYFIFDDKELLGKNLSIKIHDINGKLINSVVPNSTAHYFDCSHLAQGMYIYTLSVDNKIVSKNKLIIAR